MMLAWFILKTLLVIGALLAPTGWYEIVYWPGTRRLAQRMARQEQGLCPGCGYDLRGSITRCPECGEKITPTTKSFIRTAAAERLGARPRRKPTALQRFWNFPF